MGQAVTMHCAASVHDADGPPSPEDLATLVIEEAGDSKVPAVQSSSLAQLKAFQGSASSLPLAADVSRSADGLKRVDSLRDIDAASTAAGSEQSDKGTSRAGSRKFEDVSPDKNPENDWNARTESKPEDLGAAVPPKPACGRSGSKPAAIDTQATRQHRAGSTADASPPVRKRTDSTADTASPTSTVSRRVSEDDSPAVRRGSRSGSSQPVSPTTSNASGQKRKQGTGRFTVFKGHQEVSTAMHLVIDHPDQDINDVFDIKLDQSSVLGHGQFGKVRLGRLKVTGGGRAIKTLSKEYFKSMQSTLQMEISVTKTVDHPNIIKLYGIWESSESVYLVLELCLGGNLWSYVDLVGGLKDRTCTVVMQQIFMAVYYLHQKMIIHRDLKPDNVLLRDKGKIEKTTVKLTDFGLSTSFTAGQVFTQKCGTARYISPEVVQQKYDYRSDIWSCGCILYFCLCCHSPFSGKDEVEIHKNITKGELRFDHELFRERSQESKDLCKRLLTSHNKRLSAAGAVNHPWFKNYLPKRDEVAIPAATLNYLRNFRSENKLKQAALCVMATYLRDENIRYPRDLFYSLDADGDGSVSIDELRERLLKTSKADHMKDVCIDDTLGKVYGEKEDSLTYTEFLAATFDRGQCMSDAILKAAFSSFDVNGDGTISMSELVEGRLLGHLSPEDIKDIMTDMDTNGDSSLCFTEFTEVMRKGVVMKPPVQRKASRS
eukprot:TRINITY_DN23499_c0_g1_i1.p1 TRINITY_DN23499_c0_g1~~TRINITY_DN23499_c0_g1_i1.p1  ORF type:complete len:716 (+),score=188.15 TRINITY_DN23499_c0_g1_i1:164-2311(+)